VRGKLIMNTFWSFAPNIKQNGYDRYQDLILSRLQRIDTRYCVKVL